MFVDLIGGFGTLFGDPVTVFFVVLAALIKNKEKFKSKKIGLIMCGGNIDFKSLQF